MQIALGDRVHIFLICCLRKSYKVSGPSAKWLTGWGLTAPSCTSFFSALGGLGLLKSRKIAGAECVVAFCVRRNGLVVTFYAKIRGREVGLVIVSPVQLWWAAVIRGMVVVTKIVGAAIVGLEKWNGSSGQQVWWANHTDRDALLIADEDCASCGVTPRESE